MEEKERYELFGEHCIKDNSPDARPQLLGAYVACVILNEQDKEIEKLNACVDFYKSYYISFKGKVIDELEKVKRYIYDKAYYLEEENFGEEINEYIDNQIKELGGEENE